MPGDSSNLVPPSFLGGKPPWKPRTAAIIAFLFGPLAGAFVTWANLKRLGHSRKANLVLACASLASVVIAVVLIRMPEALTRLFGLSIEAAGAALFPYVQWNEFEAWKADAKSAASSIGVKGEEIRPASEWKAAPLGLVGMVAFLGIVFAAAIAQEALVTHHLERGDELLVKEKHVEAEREYRAALRVDPQHPGPYYGLGLCHAQEEKWDDAIGAAREGVRLDPENAYGHKLLANLLVQKGDPAARAEYCEALRLQPDDKELEQEVRLALMGMNDPRWDDPHPCP